jgi:hypothetical protein
MRRALARRLREALGKAARAANGALGISSEMAAEGPRTRRTATSMPPALTLRAVANSRHSLPLSSRLRTKTGIASGNRTHLRRSPRTLFVFTQASSLSSFNLVFTAPWGPKPRANPGESRSKGVHLVTPEHKTRSKTGKLAVIPSPCLRCMVKAQTLAGTPGSARFCHTWVIRFHFPLTVK